jgi:hypothetical protein
MVTGDALEGAYQKIVEDFEVTGFTTTAAYVLGDTTAGGSARRRSASRTWPGTP